MTADASAKPRIGLIGAGRSGSVLALALHRAGYPVSAIASQRIENAQRLAKNIPGCEAVRAQEVVDRADVVLLTVPDNAIAQVCESLSWRPGVAAVHCSGAGSLDLLAAAARQGAAAGTFHPLQSLADIEQGLANLPGSTFGVEAVDERLQQTLIDMATALEGHPLVLEPGQKTLYHASAVLAANCLVALADVAAGLWTKIGSTREEGLAALLPLMRGAVANLGTAGLPDALTGPVVRGDTETVSQHVRSLDTIDTDAAKVYRALAQRTIRLAQERGSIDAKTAAEFSALLELPPHAEGGNG